MPHYTRRMQHIKQKLSVHICRYVSLSTFNFFCCYQQRFLGDYTDGDFTDIAAVEAILRFQERLNEITETIKERNKRLKIPYVYLLPERTPNSIAI